MNGKHFADKLIAACVEKNSRLVVGLDPHPAMLPPHLVEKHQAVGLELRQAMAAAISEFNAEIIAAVADIAVAVKPQLAFYEMWGAAGIGAYEAAVKAAQAAGLLVIADGKRNDIGSSAEGYACAYLGPVEQGAETEPTGYADAVTINPYLGSDGIHPFLARWQTGKGAFALVRTSNPSAGEIQHLMVGDTPLYMQVAKLVCEWGAAALGDTGYSALGAVVGATDPKAARELRLAMPQTMFLVPGYGAQGGSAADVAAAFNPDKLGAVVNSSRDILFAYKRNGDCKAYACMAREAAKNARDGINHALAG